MSAVPALRSRQSDLLLVSVTHRAQSICQVKANAKAQVIIRVHTQQDCIRADPPRHNNEAFQYFKGVEFGRTCATVAQLHCVAALTRRRLKTMFPKMWRADGVGTKVTKCILAHR